MKNTIKKIATVIVNVLWYLITFGNSKLPKTTAIFNYGTASLCPSAKLGLCEFRTSCQFKEGCKNSCYALKAERMYPTVKPYRMRQAQYWATCTAEQFISDFIDVYNRKKIKPTLLRLNEAGDFFDQEDVEKTYKIAMGIYNATGVRTYMYTHRSDLKYYSYNPTPKREDNPKNLPHLKIIGSGTKYYSGLNTSFIGVSAAQYDYLQTEATRHNYNAVGNTAVPFHYFCAGDCKKCTLCSDNISGIIFTKIH